MRIRLRRLIVTLFALALSAWALWIVGANALLHLAPRCVDRREPVQMSFKAWTLIPGVVHVRDFKLRAEDRWSQWSLNVDSALVHVTLGSVFHRTIHAKSVDAEGVAFRIRTKRTMEELENAPEHSWPEIAGFEGPPLRDDARFPFGRPMVHPWTLEMENVRAHAKELWADGERYEGPAVASGQFKLAFDRSVAVGPVKISFERGTLEHRGDEVARALKGELEGRLHTFDPRVVRDGAILDQLDVSGSLRGDGPAETDALNFLADLNIVKGVLQQGTTLRASIPELAERVGAVKFHGKLTATAKVGAKEKISWGARVSDLKVSLPSFKGLAVEVPRADVSASSRGTRLRKLVLPTRTKVSISQAKLRDLRALNAFIPAPLGMDIQKGSGRVNATLKLDLAKHTAQGAVHVKTDGLALQHEDRLMRGTVSLDVNLNHASAKLDRVQLGKTTVKLDGMTVVQKGKVSEPFAGSVSLAAATIQPKKAQVLETHVNADFVNAKPLFRAMVDELPIPGILKGPLTPNNVNAEAKLVLGPELVRVENLQGRVGRADVRGGATMDHGNERALAEIELGRSRVGVEKQGRKTHVNLLAGSHWYDKRVASLR